MTSGFHLAVVITSADQFWPHLNAILHGHRHGGPVQRLFLLQLAPDQALPGAAEAASLLERVVRFACPGLRIDARQADAAPNGLRDLIAQCHKEFADVPWTFQLPIQLSSAGWGFDDLLNLPETRVILRQSDGGWIELVRTHSSAEILTQPFGPIRRDEADDLSIVDLVRAQTIETQVPAPLIAQPVKALPLVPITQAAMTAAWDWRTALSQSAIEVGNDSPHVLFQRYLGAFLLDLGVRNVVQGARKPKSPPVPASAQADPTLWVHHGGRLIVLDARLDAPPALAEGESSTQTALPPFASAILRAAEERRDLGTLSPDWVLIRPCLVLSPLEQSLAEAHGIRVLDESACRDLPAKLAAVIGLPLSADAIEIERRLRTHLAETGRTRVFGPESQLLQQQRAAAPDPAIVHADGLLEQIQRTRGQNWLLWAHQDRIYLRVPSENRSSASGDWRAMLAAFVGIDPEKVQSRQTQRTVLLDFPEAPEHRRRVADWLRPFLNASLTFDAVRSRFAAEARVTAEAENAARASARTPPPGPASTSTAPVTPAPLKTSKPTPSPKSTPSPKPASQSATQAPRRMQRVSLEDLDRALDSALTFPPAPDPADPKKP